MNKHQQFCELGLAVVKTELEAIEKLKSRIDDNFAKACEICLNCEGRIIVLGMGKSGHIGSKIAATLASTGTPAFFVHPGEASHGDLGMITRKDVVIAISYSGKSDEILTIVPIIKRLNVPLITITGKPHSSLAKEADVSLIADIEKEACPHNLAPTASTTAALVMGDALAIALLEARGFTKEDFALSHPGGALGRRLLLHIDDLMHTGNAIPVVKETAVISDALLEMSSKKLGMTAVVDTNDNIVGVYTDGDVRRTIEKDIDLKKTPISEVMTSGGVTAKPGILAAEMMQLLEKHRITGVFVVDDNQKICGALNIQDLLRAGVV